jgi:hypothetical protein
MFITMLVCIGLVLIPGTIARNIDEISSVTIEPPHPTVEIGTHFSLNVSCVPGQPIKGFEFKVSFNPSILQATAVTEGTIFQGHITFFHPGIINNEDGTIVNVYNLIVGPGMVSKNGTLATLWFTATSTTGIDDVHLYGVGITNEDKYLPIAVTNGTITVIGTLKPPVIGAVNPANESTYAYRPIQELSCTIADSDNSPMDVYIRWRNHTGEWVTLATFLGVQNGSYTVTPVGNDWIWGNTTYVWSVNVTDGITWTNQTYLYTTKGSRYDVNNNNKVNFQDVGLVWIHRTSVSPNDGLYDVNQDGKVNFKDAGLTWTHRN